jgi:multidrug efflux pump subunit AcrB
MLAIVRNAPSRPYTFVVAALVIFPPGTRAVPRTLVDIFPGIDIPVISAAWLYQGLPPHQMASAPNRPSSPKRVRFL